MTKTRSTGKIVSMKIHFSNQDMLRNFGNFLKSADLSDDSRLQITTNPKWITVHPASLVFAAALALSVDKDNATITDEVPPTGSYLDRMGLYDFLSTPSPFTITRREESGRFIPISIIKTQADQSRFIADIIPLLHLPEEKSRVIKYVIGELVRNVLEHSRSKNGAIVAAQYYKKSNRISIGICDTGVGIWQSLNDIWHPQTDLDAIKLALTPGITGTTRAEGGTADNAGAGLFFIKSIAKMSRSYFVVYSGKGEYTLTKYDSRIKSPRLYGDPDRDPHSELSNAPDFKGTLVAVDISLDDNEAFDKLMAAIGEVFDDAIRERKRAKFKEPRFL